MSTRLPRAVGKLSFAGKMSDDVGTPSFDVGLFADDPAERVLELVVPRHGRLAAVLGVQIEIVSAAVAMQVAG